MASIARLKSCLIARAITCFPTLSRRFVEACRVSWGASTAGLFRSGLSG